MLKICDLTGFKPALKLKHGNSCPPGCREGPSVVGVAALTVGQEHSEVPAANPQLGVSLPLSHCWLSGGIWGQLGVTLRTLRSPIIPGFDEE